MTRVLLVDDEPQLLRSLVISLKARTYDVDSAQDGAAALDAVAAYRPDVVLREVRALDGGADDYITKPFSMTELLARLGAVARRALPPGPDGSGPHGAVIETEEFSVDLLAKKDRRGGGNVPEARQGPVNSGLPAYEDHQCSW